MASSEGVEGMGNKLVQSAAIALTLIGTKAAFAADAHNGHIIAKRWCSSCHLIEPGQKGPTTEATPFATIAKRGGFDAAKLAFFLLDPHPKMPNMQLTRSEAADITAYISTLRSSRTR
jgi:mono/diheme cytochrome c family protein